MGGPERDEFDAVLKLYKLHLLTRQDVKGFAHRCRDGLLERI